MNRLIAERLVTHASAQLDRCTAQQLFDGAADRTLVKLIETARDKAAALPGSGVTVALQGHLASALALAEQLKAGRG